MAELVDAQDSKSCDSNIMRVRFSLAAQKNMHKDGFNSLKKFFRGILWLLRATAFSFIVFAGYLLLFPVQFIMWVLGAKAFSETEPYQYLPYLFEKGSLFPDEEFPHSYDDWKKKKEEREKYFQSAKK